MIHQSCCLSCLSVTKWECWTKCADCLFQGQWKLLVCCYIWLVLSFVQSRQVLPGGLCFRLSALRGSSAHGPFGLTGSSCWLDEYQPANDICKNRIHFLPWRTPDMCSPLQTHNMSTNSKHDEVWQLGLPEPSFVLTDAWGDTHTQFMQGNTMSAHSVRHAETPCFYSEGQDFQLCSELSLDGLCHL